MRKIIIDLFNELIEKPSIKLSFFSLLAMASFSAILVGIIIYTKKSYFVASVFYIPGIILLIYSALKARKYRRLNIIVNSRWICKKCSYIWKSKKKIGEPPKCPRCDSKKILHGSKIPIPELMRLA